MIGSSFLNQHLRNGDPSLERCAASASSKRLKDQQGPHLVKPGSKQPHHLLRGGFFYPRGQFQRQKLKNLVFLSKYLWLLLKEGCNGVAAL